MTSETRKSIALSRIHGILEAILETGSVDMDDIENLYQIADEQLAMDDAESRRAA